MSTPKSVLLSKRKPAKKGPGRPRIYDAEKIAKELLDWAKDEDSLNFVGFCADKGYLPELIWRLEKESTDFSHAYTIAKMKLAERRERFLNNDQLNYGAYQRYQHEYDPFLSRSEEALKDKDAARRKGVAESEQANLVLLARLASKGKISQK
jgi:hypothetical protein